MNNTPVSDNKRGKGTNEQLTVFWGYSVPISRTKCHKLVRNMCFVHQHMQNVEKGAVN